MTDPRILSRATRDAMSDELENGMRGPLRQVERLLDHADAMDEEVARLTKPPTATPPREALDAIALAELGWETLETRNSDGLDFHDTHVGSIRRLMDAAYARGAADRARFGDLLERANTPREGERHPDAKVTFDRDANGWAAIVKGQRQSPRFQSSRAAALFANAVANGKRPAEPEL